MNRKPDMKLVEQLTNEAMAETLSAISSAMNEFRSENYEQAFYWLRQVHRQNDRACSYMLNYTRPLED